MPQNDKTSDIHRPLITAEEVNRGITALSVKLAKRLNEKGAGAFVSRHEILGTIAEEYDELIEAVRAGSLDDVARELLDIGVGSVFGFSCINACKVDW